MARKRSTPEPAERTAIEKLEQARNEFNASIDTKDPAAVQKLIPLQNFLIIAQVPELDLYRELDAAADRMITAIDDTEGRATTMTLKTSYGVLLAMAGKADPAHQARKALGEAMTAKDAQLIICTLGELQEALIEGKKSVTETYRELDRAAADALAAIRDAPSRAVLRSMKASYGAVLSLSEQMDRVQPGPTQTTGLAAMTAAKG